MNVIIRIGLILFILLFNVIKSDRIKAGEHDESDMVSKDMFARMAVLEMQRHIEETNGRFHSLQAQVNTTLLLCIDEALQQYKSKTNAQNARGGPFEFVFTLPKNQLKEINELLKMQYDIIQRIEYMKNLANKNEKYQREIINSIENNEDMKRAYDEFKKNSNLSTDDGIKYFYYDLFER